MSTVQSIREQLARPVLEKMVAPDACLEWVEDINQQYLSLSRHAIDTKVLVDVKLNIIFWRRRLLRELLSRLPRWAVRNPELLANLLKTLGTYLHPAQQSMLSHVTNSEQLARLLAEQGIRHRAFPQFNATAGPGVDLNIIANRSSNWSFSKWKQNSVFGEYEFTADGVRFRGMLFRPGDVLLANVNLDGNGLYTSLTDPKGFCSHSAFFAILEDHSNRYPVVLETYEKGVRPVPLNVFLGPRFCAYVEVYRHRHTTEQHSAKINHSAMEIIESVKGYNFDSEDPDATYMSCTSIGRFLHQDAGLAPAQTKSELKHPQIKKNLSRLGYTYFKFFAPVDYLLNEHFHCVGWIDNNQIDRLLAQELVDARFRQQFLDRQIAPGKFPFPYNFNRWGLGQMRARTLIGKVIGLIEGFDHQSLPKGPDDLLAVIKLAEGQLGKSIVATRKVVRQNVDEWDSVNLQALAANPSIQTVLQQTLNLAWLPVSETLINS